MIKEVAIADLISEKISGEWGVEITNGYATKVIRTTNFTNEGRLKFDSVVEREIGKSIVEKKKLIYGDTIIEKSGGSPTQPVGRVVLFDLKSDEPYLCNNFTAILRPTKEVNPRYFFWALFSKHQSKTTLRYQNKTTGIINLKLDRYLEEEKIRLPDLVAQQKIARIIEQVDASRQKRKQANQLTEQFLQSVFREMFGDPVRNEKAWAIEQLSNLIEDGPQNGLYVPASKYGSGTPILRIDSFYDGYVENIHDLKRIEIDDRMKILYALHENDIVINRVNSRKYLGKSALIPMLNEGIVFESNMMRLSINNKRALPIFLVYQFQQSYIKQQILARAKDAVNQSSINQEDVKSIKVFIPPLSHQQKFTNIVKQVEQLQRKQSQSEMELENLFQSLMQKYFR